MPTTFYSSIYTSIHWTCKNFLVTLNHPDKKWKISNSFLTVVETKSKLSNVRVLDKKMIFDCDHQ